MGCCIGKAAPPPPEICGIWSTGPLAIKNGFPTAYAGRLQLKLPEAESDGDAWALLIVDEKGNCQYRNQGATVGSGVSASAATTYTGPIYDFKLDGGETWRGIVGFKFKTEGKAYVEHDGVKLLTTMAVNGNKFQRLTSLTLGPPVNVSVLMTCGEAEEVGVAPMLYEAIKHETERIRQAQARDERVSVSVPDTDKEAEGEMKLNGNTIVRAHSGALEMS